MIENHSKKKEAKNKDRQLQNNDNNQINFRMERMKKMVKKLKMRQKVKK